MQKVARALLAAEEALAFYADETRWSEDENDLKACWLYDHGDGLPWVVARAALSVLRGSDMA